MQLWRAAHTFIISLTARCSEEPDSADTPGMPRRISYLTRLETDCSAEDVSSLTGFKRMSTV